MKTLISPQIVVVAAVIAVVATIGGCGSKVEGTYSNGSMVTLDLKSGGNCTPKGEKADFLIHDDGSLTGPGFIGNMKKSV